MMKLVDCKLAIVQADKDALICSERSDPAWPRILIDEPLMLGDTYEEVVESLNRLADAKLTLMIRPRAERGGAST